MATDLATTAIPTSSKTLWCGLYETPKLEKLVKEAPSFSHVCSPDERAALVALVPQYEASLSPASRQGCRRAIAKLAMAYPSAKVSDIEAEARLEIYADALDDVPGDVLAAACAAALRESRFFPTPAEIRERCGMLARRKWELSKIRALVATHDRMWRPDPAPLSAKEAAEVSEIAARFKTDDQTAEAKAA
ncbi:hypothetical protein [Sphingomonas zeae]|jgi:hypothetical protein